MYISMNIWFIITEDSNAFTYSSHRNKEGSRDNVVGIATGYGLDDRGVGVLVPVRARIISSPRRSDRHWGAPNFLSNGCWGKAAGG
jgi:hypothetical protein